MVQVGINDMGRLGRSMTDVRLDQAAGFVKVFGWR